MKVAETQRRVSKIFFADDTSYKMMPLYRPDGTKIGNELEWQFEQVSIMGMQVAREMIIKDIVEKSELHKADGHLVNIGFKFVVGRSGPVSDGAPNGPEMHVSCAVIRYE